MVDAFSLTSSALPSDARVLAFRGTEALSTLYELQIHLWIEDPAFDMAPALGADMTLSINRQDEQPCVFHGILATLETVDDVARGAVYRAVLVPRLWQLTLSRHSRVFVGQTTPAILEQVLQAGGVAAADYELKLTGTYGPLEHVCQYRESDFAFLSRRMEREGIYYFFEQREGRERLIITDDKAFHAPLSTDPVRYHRVSGAGAGGIEGFRTFTCKHSTIPGSVVMKDHDYLRPALDVSGLAPASDRAEEVHLYGENFTTPEEARRLARVRAEELKARQVVYRGVGNTSLLRPGYTFALQDHPRPSVDGEYLTTELLHTGHHHGSLSGAKELLGLEGEQDEVYRVEAVAIPKSAQFRPERRTTVPRIYGTERAVVDGAAESDYAQLDEHGRYLVKIHFDESPAKSGTASARIRMMQPHGGSPESFHFPLRKGTEVLLTFEGGDPDRPVIAGVVPNVLNPSAVRAQNATKNIVQTGGGNRIIIEDAAGKQYVHIASAHKGTYLHLGSPFNPQYNKVTNTTGTSLSYTQDISTSVTGTDAQTIVEDARVTIIGRSDISVGTPMAGEITALLGASFVGAEFAKESDVLLELCAADAEKVLKDASALETALGSAGVNPKSTSPAPSLSAVQANIEGLTSDLQTLAADALSYAKSISAGSSTPPTGFDVSAWQALIQTAVSAAGTAKTAAFSATPTYPASATAETAAINAASGGPVAFPSSSSTQAFLPSPNATPNYILLPHGTHTTTLSATQAAPSSSSPPETVDTYITVDLAQQLEGGDSTAMDPLSVTSGATLSPLHPGSDIKIVGGDYASMFGFDQRTHVMGTSYGLVLTGQASVVRNGQQSKVLAPNNSGIFATLVTPFTFAPLTYPLPSPNPTPNTAQRSEVYGDQFGWVDGSTTSTVTQGSHAMVFSPNNRPPVGVTPAPAPIQLPSANPAVAQASEVHGDQYSYVDGDTHGNITGTQATLVQQGTRSEVYAPSRDPSAIPDPAPLDVTSPAPTTAQATALHGDQYSWIDGNVNATITGNKTTQVHNSTTHAALLESHCDTSYKTTAIASLDLTTMKFALSLLSMAVNGISVSAHGIAIDVGLLKIDTKGVHMLT